MNGNLFSRWERASLLPECGGWCSGCVACYWVCACVLSIPPSVQQLRECCFAVGISNHLLSPLPFLFLSLLPPQAFPILWWVNKVGAVILQMPDCLPLCLWLVIQSLPHRRPFAACASCCGPGWEPWPLCCWGTPFLTHCGDPPPPPPSFPIPPYHLWFWARRGTALLGCLSEGSMK